MGKITRFIIWICSKFSKDEIQLIIYGLVKVLDDRDPQIKPKDYFKEQHPNYRNFYVDPIPPLKLPPPPPIENYSVLLARYEATHKKQLPPVKHQRKSTPVPEHVCCHFCEAPHQYLSFNDGKKRSQINCKVCKNRFQLDNTASPHNKTKFWCPHCNYALYKWHDESPTVTIYKCGNDDCPGRLKALAQLNPKEQALQKQQPSNFKICYQYRDYHFELHQLSPSAPVKPQVDLTKIHNSQNVLGLVLTFLISFALSARKTALILRTVFGIKISYQSVLNYAESTAFHCHHVNLKYKGPIDDFATGDETYIKIEGKHHFVSFFLASNSHKITAYQLADNRGVLPATTAMLEAMRTKRPDQSMTFVTDGNPSYAAGIHYINAQNPNQPLVNHLKVIGLQNLDKESETYRPYKQIIERLNRTYKHHIKPFAGFKSWNGAMTITTLFVSNYNFLRPHMALKYKTPIHLDELDNIQSIQAKWLRLISLSV